MPGSPIDKLSGLRRLPLAERRAALSEFLSVDAGELGAALDAGLDAATADKLVENVIGTYALPLALAVHLTINGQRKVAPMVVEEPSVVAAASAACKLVSSAGGFVAEADAPIMIAQVELYEVKDVEAAARAIMADEAAIRAEADEAMSGIVSRGGGMRGLEVRQLGGGMMVVHLLVDCRDAMGANAVNTVAERVGPRLHALAGGNLGLRILSNLADRRRVRVRCAIPFGLLESGARSGGEVARAIEQASRFAQADPYRAATHNKGIMNGIDPVVIATGNDWRAIEAGAHAWAARNGRYEPLATWWCEGQAGAERLVGSLELPMALGIVGGTLGHHRGARLALKLADVRSAAELGMLAAGVGLSSNLAALRALGTEGIQRGHMSLHARSVALAAGALGDEVERVAAELARSGEVTLSAAQILMERLRGQR